MTTNELDDLDTPACPLLGLATDPRSHFTYPHPAHRCFAATRPAVTDANRQAIYCLGPDFMACDRHQAWQSRIQSVRQPGSRLPRGSSLAEWATAADTPAPGTTVIHVFRAGDSLARIAAAYGLTVDEIAVMNGLSPDVALPDGTRLVIPLAPRQSTVTRPKPGSLGADRSG